MKKGNEVISLPFSLAVYADKNLSGLSRTVSLYGFILDYSTVLLVGLFLVALYQ